MPNLSILLVSKNYYPFVGGIETQVRLLAHALAKKHQVEIAAARFEPHQLHRLWPLEDSLLLPAFASYDDEAVRVHSLSPTRIERMRMLPIAVRVAPKIRRYFHSQFRRFGYRFYRSVYVPRLRKIVRHQDIIHVFAADYLGWAVAEAAAAERVPLVVSAYVHLGQYGDDPENVAFYNSARIVFSLLETDREKLIELGVSSEKIRVSGVVPILPDTCDPSGFRVQHGIGGDPVVLFVGRLEEYKGPKAVLDAAPLVWQSLPDVHFVFVGPASDSAQRWFHGARADRVHYLGLVSEQEKADAFAACDLFCMPSRYEVLPAVYLEAWSYSKTVIGGTARGLYELIEGNDAGVTVGHNSVDIAALIVDLLGDDAARHRMGENGRRYVEANCSPDALLRTIESAYADICTAVDAGVASFVSYGVDEPR